MQPVDMVPMLNVSCDNPIIPIMDLARTLSQGMKNPIHDMNVLSAVGTKACIRTLIDLHQIHVHL